MICVYRVNTTIFLSTLSLRRATLIQMLYDYSSSISIHALLAESDTMVSIRHILTSKFLSTLSLRRATIILMVPLLLRTLFLSTLSLRRATWLRCWQLAARDISIHALLAESDSTFAVTEIMEVISIHALLAESDWKKSPPMCSTRHFYPRSPCGERPGQGA